MPDYSSIDIKDKDVLAKPPVEGEVVKEKKQSVVTKKVVRQKKGLLERLVVAMLGPDGIRAISAHVYEDIVLPAAKKMAYDSFTSAAWMALFKEDQRGGMPNQNYGNPSPSQWTTHQQRMQYDKRYQTPKATYQSEPVTYAQPARRGNFVPDYVIPERHDAIRVMDSLQETAIAYGTVSVADYYDLIGVSDVSMYTDNTQGWSADDLAGLGMQPARGGFIIKLPPPRII